MTELGFGIASFFGVLIPLFVNYEAARDITRFTATGLILWLFLSIQPIWRFIQRASLGYKVSQRLVTPLRYLAASHCSLINAPPSLLRKYRHLSQAWILA